MSLLALGCDCEGDSLRVPSRVTATPDPLDFGSVLKGAAVSKRVVLANAGLVDVGVEGHRFDGAAAASFTAQVTPSTLPAGGSLDVAVTLNAGVVGALAAELVVPTDSSETPEVRVGLAAQVVAACEGATRVCNGFCINVATTETDCTDDVDDDCDGKADCADPDCGPVPTCATCPPGPDEATMTLPLEYSTAPAIAFDGAALGVTWLEMKDATSGEIIGVRFARASALGVPDPSSRRDIGGPGATGPAITSDGSGWGLAWCDRGPSSGGAGDVVFQALDAGGATGGELRVENGPTASTDPAMAWNERDGVWGVGWTSGPAAAPGTLQKDRDWWFAQVPKAATTVQGARQVTSSGRVIGSPALAWNGTHYAAAWAEGDEAGGGAIQWQLFAADGSPVTPTAITLATLPSPGNVSSTRPRIAWAGEQWGIVFGGQFGESGDVTWLARVPAGGGTSSAPVAISKTREIAPDLVGLGTSFAIVGARLTDFGSRIDVHIRDLDGALVRDAVDLSCERATALWPAITWTGTRLAVAWSHYPFGAGERKAIRVKTLVP